MLLKIDKICCINEFSPEWGIPVSPGWIRVTCLWKYNPLNSRPVLSSVVGQADGCTHASKQAHSSGPHSHYIFIQAEQAAAQQLCWSEAKNIRAPQTQLCAFTDSHCVAGSNTCTYFSMVSLASTTRSLSAHMSCVLLQSESGNQWAQREWELSVWAQSCGCQLHDIILKVHVGTAVIKSKWIENVQNDLWLSYSPRNTEYV